MGLTDENRASLCIEYAYTYTCTFTFTYYIYIYIDDYSYSRTVREYCLSTFRSSYFGLSR